MIILLCASFTGTFLYLGLLGFYYKWWSKQAEIQTQIQTQGEDPLPFISVVIAARNESTQIEHCLQSVLNQSYPADRYEVIVVDDQSDDDTYLKASQYRILLLSSHPHGSGKKQALSVGIDAAKGLIIATTDADCIVPASWLFDIAQTFDQRVQLVTGPVLYRSSDSTFDKFQALDVMSLAFVTAAGIKSGIHHLANGANMAFRREAYRSVSGFDTGRKYASGDDLFLAQAIAQLYPGSVKYLWGQTTVVSALPCATVKSFVEQRIRWASKNSALPETSVFWIWAGIWMVFTLNIIAVLASAFNSSLALGLAVLPIAGIIYTEYRLLRRIAMYYNQLYTLKGYLTSAAIHYCYVVLIGVITPFRKCFTWKGRRLQ